MDYTVNLETVNSDLNRIGQAIKENVAKQAEIVASDMRTPLSDEQGRLLAQLRVDLKDLRIAETAAFGQLERARHQANPIAVRGKML